MDDKEATPVEDIKAILTPAEPTKTARPEEQPERPTQTGDANLLEMMMEETLKNNNKELNKKNGRNLKQK